MLTVAVAAPRLSSLSGPLMREDAADAARRELSRPEYAREQPPLVLRVVGRAVRAVGDLLDSVWLPGPAQPLLRAVLALAAVAVVVAVLLRLGPLRGARTPAGAVFDGGPALTAAGHRARAEELAARGRYADAVRERLRAVVRELEVRGVLDPRPSRTAGEVARDAGAAVPALLADLQRAAAVFDEVWYGGRPADADGYAVLVALDGRVRTAGLVPS